MIHVSNFSYSSWNALMSGYSVKTTFTRAVKPLKRRQSGEYRVLSLLSAWFRLYPSVLSAVLFPFSTLLRYHWIVSKRGYRTVFPSRQLTFWAGKPRTIVPRKCRVWLISLSIRDRQVRLIFIFIHAFLDICGKLRCK